jgi:hypothetical protein
MPPSDAVTVDVGDSGPETTMFPTGPYARA